MARPRLRCLGDRPGHRHRGDQPTGSGESEIEANQPGANQDSSSLPLLPVLAGIAKNFEIRMELQPGIKAKLIKQPIASRGSETPAHPIGLRVIQSDQHGESGQEKSESEDAAEG